MKTMSFKKVSKRFTTFSASVMFFLLSFNASAIDCYTDCGAVASFRYPCPTFSNPGRKCTGRDPVVYGSCEATKVAACQVLAPLKDAIIGRMVAAVASDGQVRDRARGWTTTSCATVGGSLILAVNAAYATPICAAFNVAAAGCATFVLSSGAAVIGGTCAQLCTDRHLADC